MTSKCLTKCKKSANSANILTAPEIFVWGNNLQTRLNTTIPQSIKMPQLPQDAYIVKISNGNFSALALDNLGNVYSQGDNSSGQLANGTLIANRDYRPINISSLPPGTKFKDISMGSGNTSIFLTTTGKVYTAGNNGSGQLGIGSFVPSSIPVPVLTNGVLNGKNIVSVSMGAINAAVLDDAGVIYTWGSGFSGQLGNGFNVSSNAPVQVLTATRYRSVHAGGSSVIAITTAGTLNTWGYNGTGSLGNGTLIDSNVPVNVIGLPGEQFISASISSNFAGAVTTEGEIYTWGTNFNGVLGQGLANNVQVLTPQKVRGIIAGIRMKQIVVVNIYNYMVALSETGYVYTWGNGGSGFLGNGTFVSSNVPTGAVAGLLSDKVVTQITGGTEVAVLTQ